MTKGLGRMMRFQLLDNFNYPYMALSMTEFWRRWHMAYLYDADELFEIWSNLCGLTDYRIDFYDRPSIITTKILIR